MKLQTNLRRLVLLATLAVAAAIATALLATPGGSAASNGASENAPGAVYAMTNERAGNRILVYDRHSDGTLAPPRSVATGGTGSGAIDQSANSLVLAGGNYESSQAVAGGSAQFLFTVNTGSNSVSSFRVKSGDPVLADVESGLDHPISVAYSKHRLFVLNAGNQSCQGSNPTITGFTVDARGELTPIPGSTREVPGGPESGCTMISFNPRGDVLVVSEKLADLLITYTVSREGIPSAPIVNNTTGVDPFGFAFTRQNQLITSENYNSMGGAVSTYDVPESGVLVPISPSVLNGRNDACWVAITNDEKYFYVSNAVSGDVSSYTLDNDGNIALLEAVAGNVGPMAFDEAMSNDSKYLYIRSLTPGTIEVFAIQQDGSLIKIQSIGGLPPGSEGLAAR